MNKITAESRALFSEGASEYADKIAEHGIYEKRQISERAQETGIGAFSLCRIRINLASICLALNRLSLALLNIRNEQYLSSARKHCHAALSYLERILTNEAIFNPAEYIDIFNMINSVPDTLRFQTVRLIGFTIQSLDEDSGLKSKWHWSFVDMFGRFASMAVTITDFRGWMEKNDPRIDGYVERMNHLDTIKYLLPEAARRYREKYELSSRSITDMRRAIDMLNSMEKLHRLLGEVQSAKEIKKQSAVWSVKLERDQRSK